MGAAREKKRRAAAGGARAAGPAALPASAPRSWWFDFEVSRAHLVVLRVAFFGILAIDAFLQVRHAPRYGAGDFNVAHLSWLPLPSPGREGMLALQLSLCYLCVLAALGVWTRVVVPLAAALFGYAYFASQLDSYQHHYLVALLLVIACFVPWEAREARVRSWALRLFTVQIAVVYLWTTIAKLDPLWLDGTTLSQQLRPKWIRDLLGEAPADYRLPALAVVAGEAFLAVAWLWRLLWLPALAVGVAFHVGVELADFEIGQFSYIMFAIYTLLLPEAIVAAPARLAARVRARRPAWSTRTHAIAGGVALAAALVAGAALLPATRLPVPAWVVAGTAAVAIGAFAVRRRWEVAAAHLAACVLIVGLARTTSQPVDYYRLWAGSARWLGKPDEMKRAYEALLRIEPGHGPANYHLGRLALGAGEHDRALAHFRRTQAAEPAVARGAVGEARVLAARGDLDGARAALDRALAIDPADRDARGLRAALDRGAPQAAAPQGPDGDGPD